MSRIELFLHPNVGYLLSSSSQVTGKSILPSVETENLGTIFDCSLFLTHTIESIIKYH